MFIRFLLLFGAVSMAAAQSASPVPGASLAPAAQAVSAAPQTTHEPVIRFEDANDKAGINFMHSFGSRQLGSLLEGTGAGCIWFDYNNSGLDLSMWSTGGRWMTRCIRIRCKEKPDPPPHNHLYRNDGNGHFTDVTEQAGLESGYVSVWQ